MPHRPFSVILAATSFLVAGSFPAVAIEPDAVAQALGAALTKGSNVAATYDAARAEGSNVIVNGLMISRLSSDQTVRFDKVVVESPTQGGSGVFQSPLISFAGGTFSGESEGSIGTVSVTDATVLDPARVKGDMLGDSILFRLAEVTDLHLARKSEPDEVTIDRISVESGNVVDNLAQDSKGTVENISLSPEMFPAGTFTPATIGYDKLAFDVSWDSTRDVAAKTITIRDFTLDVHDGGELSVEGVMGNLPDPRALDDAGAASKASKAEVHRLTVHYRDNSLAGRVLDALAKRQGLSRDQYVQQLSAALPFLLLTLNNPAFQSQVTSAVTGFLKDPHSLTIKLDPDSPVSGTEILSMLKSAPGTVPDRLKASVTANSPE